MGPPLALSGGVGPPLCFAPPLVGGGGGQGGVIIIFLMIEVNIRFLQLPYPPPLDLLKLDLLMIGPFENGTF